MTPPRIPEGRNFTQEEFEYAAYVDAFNAAEDLFTLLKRSQEGSTDIARYTFDGSETPITVPGQLRNAYPNESPNKMTIEFDETNGWRPNLSVAYTYGDRQLIFSRSGNSTPDDSFQTYLKQDGTLRSGYSPIAAAEIRDILLHTALREDNEFPNFINADKKAIDIQDPRIAFLIKGAMSSRASSKVLMTEYELAINTPDNYVLTAQRDSSPDKNIYTIMLARSSIDDASLVERSTKLELTLCDYGPGNGAPTTYRKTVAYKGQNGPQSFGIIAESDEYPAITAEILDIIIAASRAGCAAVNGSLPHVASYEQIADQERRFDDPRDY